MNFSLAVILLVSIPAYAEDSVPRQDPAKIVNLGGMPTCQDYAAQAPVPDATKTRLRKAITEIKEWEKLYNQTWDDYTEYDLHCKAYVKDPTQDKFQIQELGNMANTLAGNLSELRHNALDMAPTVKSLKEKPKNTPGSFLNLKKTVDKESEMFVKKYKDQRRADQAKKCGMTLDHHGAAVVNYMDIFDRRAKNLCKIPGVQHDDPGDVQ